MFATVARTTGILAGAVLTAVALGHTAGAQTPRPSPTPAPTPVAFAAHAHANVTVVVQGTTYSGSLQLGVAQRTNLTRIDVLAVKSDTLPIPPIGLTAVIDRGANTITVWNDVTKQYRMQPFLPRAASPTPRASASPRPSPPPRQRRSPFADLDVLSLNVKLTGHTTTSGLATTGLAFDFQVQRKGDKAASHVVATTQLADEFAVFPVALELSVEPGMAPVSAKLSYALDDLTRETPPASRFVLPAGYSEARSLLDVILQRRTTPAPAAVPTPR